MAGYPPNDDWLAYQDDDEGPYAPHVPLLPTDLDLGPLAGLEDIVNRVRSMDVLDLQGCGFVANGVYHQLIVQMLICGGYGRPTLLELNLDGGVERWRQWVRIPDPIFWVDQVMDIIQARWGEVQIQESITASTMDYTPQLMRRWLAEMRAIRWE